MQAKICKHMRIGGGGGGGGALGGQAIEQKSMCHLGKTIITLIKVDKKNHGLYAMNN